MKTAARGSQPSRQAESRSRIYCAGPLFNRAEQAEMAEIAAALEGAGFRTFLPQRDGLVFDRVHRELLRGGYEPGEARRMVQLAIFRLDVYEVLRGCQGLVANLNGRVPDEGAVAEAAMAWSAGKAVLLYKSDSRSLVQGSDNPLVAGFGQFALVATIQEVAYAFTQLFRRPVRPGPTSVPAAVRSAITAGGRLSAALAVAQSTGEIVAAVISATRPGKSGL